MRITDSNTVILDLCSNCAYMGTSNLGLPEAAEKFPIGGKYHIKGTFRWPLDGF